MDKMLTVGLIIGRFQPLHKGHLLLINTSLKENPESIVLIGSSNKFDKYNPYSYQLRKNLIEGEFPGEELFIGELPDFTTDEKWVHKILSYIPTQVSHCKLYCGDKKNDSAVISLTQQQNTLPFSLEIIEIPRSIIHISATEIRQYIEQSNTKKLQQYLGEYTYRKLKEQ